MFWFWKKEILTKEQEYQRLIFEKQKEAISKKEYKINIKKIYEQVPKNKPIWVDRIMRLGTYYTIFDKWDYYIVCTKLNFNISFNNPLLNTILLDVNHNPSHIWEVYCEQFDNSKKLQEEYLNKYKEEEDNKKYSDLITTLKSL